MRVTLIQTDTLHVEALISRESSHAPWSVLFYHNGKLHDTMYCPPHVNNLHESEIVEQARKAALWAWGPKPHTPTDQIPPADLPETPPAV